MGDVEPLPESDDAETKALPINETISEDAVQASPSVSSTPTPSAPVMMPASQSETRNEPELSHGAGPGLDRRSRERMRRGQVDIGARIDLHGMTQAEAHRALGGFLFDAQTSGQKAVLVITGKGKMGEGILRDAVPRWLNEPDNRRMIRAFSYAAPKDGGEGALYVLLKRLK